MTGCFLKNYELNFIVKNEEEAKHFFLLVISLRKSHSCFLYSRKDFVEIHRIVVKIMVHKNGKIQVHHHPSHPSPYVTACHTSAGTAFLLCNVFHADAPRNKESYRIDIWHHSGIKWIINN